MRYAARGGAWKRPGHDILPPSTDPGWVEGWGVPTFRDEFESPTIDTTKWRVQNNTFVSYDWAYVTASQAFIRDNQLVLQCKKRTTPITTSDGKVRSWDTGYIDTVGKFTALYGRWEMRAKLSTVAGHSNGSWSSWWMRNGNVGEIDMLESWGDPPNRARSASLTETSTFTMHENTNGGGLSKGWTIEQQIAGNTAPYDAASAFHTWTFIRTPTYIQYLLDGVQAIYVTPAQYPWAWGPTFDSPWHMRLELAMGDPYWTPNPDPALPSRNDPLEQVVDYIRYWPLPA